LEEAETLNGFKLKVLKPDRKYPIERHGFIGFIGLYKSPKSEVTWPWQLWLASAGNRRLILYGKFFGACMTWMCRRLK